MRGALPTLAFLASPPRFAVSICATGRCFEVLENSLASTKKKLVENTCFTASVLPRRSGRSPRHTTARHLSETPSPALWAGSCCPPDSVPSPSCSVSAVPVWSVEWKSFDRSGHPPQPPELNGQATSSGEGVQCPAYLSDQAAPRMSPNNPPNQPSLAQPHPLTPPFQRTRLGVAPLI